MALAWATNATASNNTGAAVTSSLGTTAAGQLIVITISDDSAGATSITSVTDTFANTWIKVPIVQGTSSVLLNSSSTQMWYAALAVSKAGASHTVTVNWNTATTARVTVAASYFNGFVNTPTLDKFLGATGTGIAPSTGATATTTAAAEVVVGGFGHASTTSAFSLGTGYTNLATQNIANAAVAQESKIVSATAAMTATASIAASRAWGAIVATFKDVAGTTTTSVTKGTQYNLQGSAASTLQDNANDNSIAATWDKTTYSADATRVLEQNTRWEITHSTGPQYNTLATTGIYNLVGSYAFVKLTDAGNQSLVSHEAIFGVQFGTTNKLYFDINTNTINAYKVVAGVQTAVFTGTTYTAATHVYFKIRESGGTVFFDYSTAGSSFTNLGSVASPFALIGIQPFMQAGCYAVEASGSYAYFDDFNISPATTIGITKSAKYAVRTSVAPTKSLKYTTRITQTAITKTTKYTVKKTPTALTKSLKYTVIKSISLTKPVKYTIQTTGSAITKAARYAVKTTTSATKSLKYTVKKPIASTKSLKYSLRTTPLALTKGLRYAIRTILPLTKPVKYTLRTTPAAATKGLQYKVKRPVAVTKSLKYTVTRPITAITKGARYAVLKPRAATKTLTYGVRRSLPLTKAVKYTVRLLVPAATKQLRYAVRTSAAATKSLRYVARAGGVLHASLTYTIKRPHSATKTLQYTVRSSLPFTRPLHYGVKLTPLVTRQLKYEVRKSLASTKTVRYTVVDAYTQNKSLRYAVVAYRLSQLAARYELRTSSLPTKQVRYAVANANILPLPLQYGIGDIPRHSLPLPLGQHPSALYLIPKDTQLAANQTDVAVRINNVRRSVLELEQKSNSIMLQ